MQDCPDGEKCVPYATTGGIWDANKCVPIIGDGHPGDPCSSGGVAEATDDCDATSICWDVEDVDGESVGTCIALCTGTPDAPVCADGTTCLIANDSSVTVCVPVCDPIAQDCQEGDGCYWFVDAFMCIFHAGDPTTGTPCGFINDCQPGNSCVASDLIPACAGAACCAAFCSLTEPSCADGTACVSFFADQEAPAEWADIGICLPP